MKIKSSESGVLIRISAYMIFFLSGAAALIYEISWSRQIGLLFGHTVHAASIVLASYFAGMAIGYLLGARISSRLLSRTTPLLGYAVAELVVALWAFAIPFLLDLSESSTIAPLLTSSSVAWQTSTRAVFCFLLLLPATIALGVTLPMMAAFLSGGQRDGLLNRVVAARVSFAYALNTAGAFAGVLLATYYLLLNVGVCRSSYLAAIVSIVCACGAWIISIRSKSLADSVDSVDAREPRQTAESNHSAVSLEAMFLAFISGFGILALQVLYTRMFSLVFHNSTYTFGLVIAVFLAALSTGAALVSLLQRRIDARKLIGVVMSLGALATTSSVILFVWWTELQYFGSGDSFARYIFDSGVLVFAVVAPPIVCLGMILPLVWKSAESGGNTGRVVGVLTSVNTVAAAMGALTASFVLLRWVGLWPSMVLVSVVFLAASFSILWTSRQKTFSIIVGVLLVAVSAIALSSPEQPEYASKKYQERIVKRWDSSYGWIDVVEQENGALKIRQNLHYRFGKTGNNAREFRQAHIPLLLHADPGDVLFLGLGTGLTAGGAVPHEEVNSIVAVELIPEVVDAARLLADHNYNVVDHSKVSIHVDDARHFLLATEKKFDVIIADLFVPWESETGYLYTVEHYRVARSRLKQGGLYCQWLPLYQVGEREFESIADSFASVFPHTTIWWGQMAKSKPVVALIGSDSPIVLDPERTDDRLARLKNNVGLIDPTVATPRRIWDLYLGDWPQRSSANLNTDEFPRVEFLTPVTNRNREMISGPMFESYFDQVLSLTPSESAIYDGEQRPDSVQQRRGRQKTILFGR